MSKETEKLYKRLGNLSDERTEILSQIEEIDNTETKITGLAEDLIHQFPELDFLARKEMARIQIMGMKKVVEKATKKADQIRKDLISQQKAKETAAKVISKAHSTGVWLKAFFNAPKEERDIAAKGTSPKATPSS